nr:hypothetical protein CFP56_57905 [Quercus suber]
MSSATHPKRRRLNPSTGHTNNAALSRPFVSPVRRDGAVAAAGPKQPSTANISPARAPTASKQQPGDIIATKTRCPPGFKPASNKPDPSLATHQASLRALERDLAATRTQLDTLRQAERLRSTSSNAHADADLTALRRKWVRVAQDAAEEVFGESKERVMRMGGVRAWKQGEEMRQQQPWGGEGGGGEEEEDDGDCEFDSQGEELPEDEQAWRKKEKARVKRERREAADISPPPPSRTSPGRDVDERNDDDDDVSNLLPLLTTCMEGSFKKLTSTNRHSPWP